MYLIHKVMELYTHLQAVHLRCVKQESWFYFCMAAEGLDSCVSFQAIYHHRYGVTHLKVLFTMYVYLQMRWK